MNVNNWSMLFIINICVSCSTVTKKKDVVKIECGMLMEKCFTLAKKECDGGYRILKIYEDNIPRTLEAKCVDSKKLKEVGLD